MEKTGAATVKNVKRMLDSSLPGSADGSEGIFMQAAGRPVGKVQTGRVLPHILLLFGFFFAVGTTWAQQADPFQAGLAAFRVGDFEHAASLFEQAAAKNPENRQAYLLAARCYTELGDWDDARDILRRAAQRFRDDQDIAVALAGVYVSLGEYAEAANWLENVVARNPFRADLREKLGIVLLNAGVRAQQKGDLRRAISLYRRCSVFLPEDIRPLQNMAAALLTLGKVDSALQVVQTALSISPGNESLLKLQAAVFQKKGDVGGLLRSLEPLVRRHPDSVRLALDLALLYRMAHRQGQALALYDSLMSRFPTRREVFEAAAQYYWDHLNYEKVRGTWKRYLRAVPDDVSAYLEIARAWEAEGKWEEAAKIYRMLRKSRPYDRELLAKEAEALRRGRDWQGAAQVLKSLAQVDSLDGTVWFALGQARANMGRFDDALEAYKRAARLDSLWGDPWIEMGKIWEKRWRPAKAETCFKRAVEVGTSDPYPYHKLAGFALQRGDTLTFQRFEERALAKAVQTIATLETNLRAGLQQLREIQASRVRSLSETAEKLQQAKQVLEEAAAGLRQVRDEAFDNYLERLLQRYPGAKALWALKGQLAEENGHWEEAAEIYRKLLALDATYVEGQKGLARCLEHLGRTKEALQVYERALMLAPEDESIYRSLLRLARESGQLEMLVKAWKRLAEFHPEWAFLQKYLSLAVSLKEERATSGNP